MSRRRFNPFKRSGKYNAKRTEVDGITFASKREAARYVQLRLLLKARRIADLELQPSYPLSVHGRPVLIRSKGFPNGRAVVYRADFRYRDFDRGGSLVVEDVKGMDTDVSRLKRALVEALYGVRVEVI